MTILRERSSLSEETLESMGTEEIFALAQDYPDPLDDALPVEEGTGARQDELESRSMAAAPAGGQRQNTISRDSGSPDEPLSGREAYEQRNGGGN